MFEDPFVDPDRIVTALHDAYGVHALELTLLSLGADPDTVVHRAVAAKGAYFVKLRRGVFDEASVTVPRFLANLGVAQIIDPVPTRTGRPWAQLGGLRMIVYPFVDGRSALEVPFTDQHWIELGAALTRIHRAVLPRALAERLQRETYAGRWRELAKGFVERGVAGELGALLRERRDEILEIVMRAEQLASSLRARPPGLTLCHSDLHAGNMLIDANARLFIVDWDNPILAPRERDLMFVGGAQGFIGHTPEQEEALFYGGYGRTTLDPIALAYYRYERVIQDVAVNCAQPSTDALRWLQANFVPGGTIARARSADPG